MDKTVNRNFNKKNKLFILAIAFVLLTFYLLAIEPVVNIGEAIGRIIYQMTH